MGKEKEEIGDTMSKLARIEALEQRHKELEEVIEQKYKDYAPDFEINDLKKRKLRIQDELLTLKGRTVEYSDN
jgi:hypothetical protein